MRLTSALRLGQRLNDARFAGWQCGFPKQPLSRADHVVSNLVVLSLANAHLELARFLHGQVLVLRHNLRSSIRTLREPLRQYPYLL